MVCFPNVQIALADGLNRFWKIPVSAPMDWPPAPMLSSGSYEGRIVLGQSIVMPGNTGDPKLLIEQSGAEIVAPAAEVKAWHALVNCDIENGWVSVL